MESKDPVFLFYPAKVAEDTQLMNRLERGCYLDILKAQKRFGKFTLQQIEKILAEDFKVCWPAVEMVLTNENGLYFIGWVQEALEARKSYSESRSKNRSSKKQVNKISKSYEIDTNNICSSHEKDMNNICSSHDGHMVNTIINTNENTKDNGGKGEKGDFKMIADDLGPYVVPKMLAAWKLQFPKYLIDLEHDMLALGELARALCAYLEQPQDFADQEIVEMILELWHNLNLHIKSNPHYSSYNLSQIAKYIQSILQSYNKPKAPDKTAIQYLFDRFCEGQLHHSLISEENYMELHKRKLIAVDQKLLNQVKANRIKTLNGSNQASDLRLLQAYQSGKDPDGLIKQDEQTIILHAKRTAVIAFFKKQKAANATNILNTENRKLQAV